MKNLFTLLLLLFTTHLTFGQFELNCNDVINISLDNSGTVTVVPDMVIEGTPNPIGIYHVEPSFLDCTDVNIFTSYTVYEFSVAGDTIQSCEGIIIVEDKLSPIAVVNADVEVSVSTDPSVFTTLTPEMIDEGSWDNCGIESMTLSQTQFNIYDVGETIVTMTVMDPSGNISTAWTTVHVVSQGSGNGMIFCDTECHSTPLGDCNSGHTSEDLVELPCDISLGSLGEISILALSPSNLISIFSVPVADAEVELIDSTGLFLASTYEDVILLQNPIVKIIRTWTMLEWTTGEIAVYNQLIEFEGSIIEESDYTLDFDDVTWPSDIAINDLRITPDELFNISGVPFEDTRPILDFDVPPGVEIDYTDEIVGLGSFELDIEREWSVSKGSTLFQHIQFINITVDSDIDSLVTVTTHAGRAMPDVDINGVASTDDQGIAYVDPGNDIDLEFLDEPLNNVDMLDLILIRRHILAMITLSPYQVLAADINGNNMVTSLDLVLLERMILGIDDATDKLVWNFDQTENLLGERNYIGYKIGDINDDSVLGNVQPDNLAMYIQDQLINAGESYVANIGIGSDIEIAALDLNLSFDLEQLDIQQVYINTESDRLPVSYTIDTNGNLRIVNALLGTARPNVSSSNEFAEAVIEVEFTANDNGLLSRMLQFNEDQGSYIINANDEIFLIDGSVSGEILTSTHDITADYGLTIYPNPASSMINISNTLTQNAQDNAQVRILDPMGRVVYNDSSSTNTISIEGFAEGIYVLSLITTEGVDSKQFMIRR